MNATIKTTLTTLAATLAAIIALSATPALANGNKARRPMRAGEQRTTVATIDRYEKPMRVIRERTEMKQFAVFSADPQAIENEAIMLFEAKSESANGSVSRWRCVAVKDVAECLGRAVKIRYLPEDERVVLEATLKPKHTAESIALVEQARANLLGMRR